MLIDEIKAGIGDRNIMLYWVGFDARHPDEPELIEADQTDGELCGDLTEILSAATPYDCVSLSELLEQQWGAAPFRYVADCIGPMPPSTVTGIEHTFKGHRGLVLFETAAVTETPFVSAYYLRERTLERQPQRQVTIVRNTEAAAERTPLPTARWLVSVSVLSRVGNGAFIFVDSFGAYFCDASGQMITGLLTNPRINARIAQDGPQSPEGQRMEQLLKLAAHHLNVGGMILNLLACKNVRAVDREIAPALAKARQRRNKPPLTIYKTLTVTVPGTKRQTDSPQQVLTTGSEAGAPRALHTVRGHQADYRERGLFGKLKGIFWIPEHERGKKEAGVVEKDYKLRGAAMQETSHD